MTALRVSAALPVGVGCVARIEVGVAVVLTDAGEVRASYGGRMLADVAGDPTRAPRAGDWVSVRYWPDGRSTLEECLTGPTATVLPFRRPRPR